MTRRQYAGGASRTTIVGAIASTGGGTVVIADTTGWPDGSIGKFHVVVDPGTSAEEKILVDLLSGTTLSFSSGGRGADGTVATSHSPGATIWHCYTALDADEANAHINTATASHAASAIAFTPVGNIAATNAQDAIANLDGFTDNRLDIIEAADTTRDSRLTTLELLGTKAYAEVTSTQGGIGPITDLTSLAVTFTAVAGRRYKITGEAMFQSTTSNQIGALYIRTGSTTLQYRQLLMSSISRPMSVTATKIVVPGAGSVTYKLSASNITASGTDMTLAADPVYPAFILVEDIGT